MCQSWNNSNFIFKIQWFICYSFEKQQVFFLEGCQDNYWDPQKKLGAHIWPDIWVPGPRLKNTSAISVYNNVCAQVRLELKLLIRTWKKNWIPACLLKRQLALGKSKCFSFCILKLTCQGPCLLGGWKWKVTCPAGKCTCYGHLDDNLVCWSKKYL